MSHAIKMLLGCLLAVSLIFILPLFGLSQGVVLVIFIVVMLGCHLLMMGGHRDGHDHKDGSNSD